MKERIYTIPVNDAFNEECECAMCKLEEKTTNDLLNYFLGPSLMEPDVRMVTNKKGFCQKHLTALYNRQENRLGLGLMLHTHFVDLCDDVNTKLSKAVPSQNTGFFSGMKGDYKDNLAKAAEMIKKRVESCALCDRLDYTIDRYVDVILWQYFEDKAFRERFAQTKGFCLPHIAMLLEGAAKYLSQKDAATFVKALSLLQNQSMDTLRDELEWFTQKFDYKNEDKPWGNSRDAIPRAIRKIVGNSDLNQ
ncbi:MAG: DUF6062 family protein [Saccharofermentanales bacterium]